MEPAGITISCLAEGGGRREEGGGRREEGGGGRELERRELEPLPEATAGSMRVEVLCGGQTDRDGMP